MRKLLALWIRLHRMGAEIGRRRANERALVQLDTRTLKDIGLEPWRNQLGATIEQVRSQSRRWTEARVGMY